MLDYCKFYLFDGDSFGVVVWDFHDTAAFIKPLFLGDGALNGGYVEQHG